MEALSGIDVALWDLKGKILDRPVYELLGGAQRQKIWAYASSLRFRGIETTVEEAKEFVARGYDAMKLKIGSNLHRYETDLELATAVRQAVGPDVFLTADANCGMERTAAMQLARTGETQLRLARRATRTGRSRWLCRNGSRARHADRWR
jgi:D-galactarolactone cycloisomerase